MCGGDIELSSDKTFGTCEYCGCTTTLPKISDEQRAAAFNRGNHFRRIGEFDKALAVYERIVREDDTDAEAHWCCALCRFGIEYVEDPTTYEWLPTCHRVSFDSFLEDVDYKAALENSTGITHRQYLKDGSKIAEVQRGILATSSTEEPFDVFAVKTIRSEDIVQGVLDMGINADAKDALAHYLDKFKNTDIVKKMIDCGANVNYVVQEDKDTAYSILGYAVFCKKYDLAKMLLMHGADPNQKRTSPRKYSYHYYDGDVWSSYTAEEYSPISDTIWRTKDINMLKLLLSYGGNPNVHEKRAIVTTDDKKKTWLCGYAKYNPILDAFFYSNSEFIQILLDNGADPNIKYFYEGISDHSNASIEYKTEIPVLGIAVIAKDRDVINMLINAGASFSAEAAYQTRGRYIENSGGNYEWKEDRFPLSKYAFSDEVIAKVGDIIRANGWRGKGFLEKKHYCPYRA